MRGKRREVRCASHGLFYRIDRTNGIDEGAEIVSLENLMNLGSLVNNE